MSVFFADLVSCTNMDWLHPSHKAEKRRQDSVSHGRPDSSKESSLEQHAESCKITPRIKDNTKCDTHRNVKPRKRAPRHARRQEGEEARRRPSHIDLVGLGENATLQVRNTKNRQLRCNKGKSLSASKRSKFEHRFSNSISSIFDAEDI